MNKQLKTELDTALRDVGNAAVPWQTTACAR